MINLKKRIFKKILLCKIFFLIAILFLLISASGCSRKKAVEKKLEDIRTGTQGIVMSFLPNAPPDKIHVDDSRDADNSFDIILELRNKGAYPQPNEGRAPAGTVVVSGFDTNIIRVEPLTGTQSYQSFEDKALEGKSTINPNGGLDLLNFKGGVDVNNLHVEKYEPTLLATACYRYKTIAGPLVCIDPNPFSTANLKKVCQVQSVSLSNQGAPIAVTRIDEESLGARTQFKITIKNVGGGDVIKNTVNDQCTVVERDNLDKVEVNNVVVGNTLLICRPFIDFIDSGSSETSGSRGYIRLINGEGFVICELPKTQYKSNTAYTTPMTIELSYNYRNTVEKKIQIKKEMGGSGSSDYRPPTEPSPLQPGEGAVP